MKKTKSKFFINKKIVIISIKKIFQIKKKKKISYTPTQKKLKK